MMSGSDSGLERKVRPMARSTWARSVSWRPCAEIKDAGTCYELRMPVHGVVTDRLHVEIRDEVVVVTGPVESGPHPRRSEESGFHRLIGLPSDAARSGGSARLEGEILVVRVPKRDVAAGSRIELLAGES